MSDRIVVLNNGTIQQVGDPDTIYNEPANLFVADFIGSPSMNTFDVRLDGDKIVSDAFEYRLSEENLEHVRNYVDDGDDLILGIRPENIRIVDETEENAIEAHLDVREPVGSDNYLYFTMGGEECRVRVPGDTKPEEGTELPLQFDQANLHLFRPSTGENILASTGQTSQAVASAESTDSVATAED